MTKTSEFLTTTQVAEILGVARCTVSYRVRKGIMRPAFTLPGNGNFLFDPDEIRALSHESFDPDEITARANKGGD